MTVHVALLRAVNVGGTGKLPMAELRALCERCGYADPQTYIQSGNVLFRTRRTEQRIKRELEAALAERMGKPVGVLVRSAEQLAALEAACPFAQAAPNQVLVLFLDRPPEAGALDGVRIPGREALRPIGRELWIHFPDGMGRSKLKIPLADRGTGRNLNTVTRLAAMARELAD